MSIAEQLKEQAAINSKIGAPKPLVKQPPKKDIVVPSKKRGSKK